MKKKLNKLKRTLSIAVAVFLAITMFGGSLVLAEDQGDGSDQQIDGTPSIDTPDVHQDESSDIESSPQPEPTTVIANPNPPVVPSQEPVESDEPAESEEPEEPEESEEPAESEEPEESEEPAESEEPGESEEPAEPIPTPSAQLGVYPEIILNEGNLLYGKDVLPGKLKDQQEDPASHTDILGEHATGKDAVAAQVKAAADKARDDYLKATIAIEQLANSITNVWEDLFGTGPASDAAISSIVPNENPESARVNALGLSLVTAENRENNLKDVYVIAYYKGVSEAVPVLFQPYDGTEELGTNSDGSIQYGDTLEGVVFVNGVELKLKIFGVHSLEKNTAYFIEMNDGGYIDVDSSANEEGVVFEATLGITPTINTETDYYNTRFESMQIEDEKELMFTFNLKPGSEDSPVETPPVETPPVETPPVETPPVETPPVETPPVETPPVETPPVETPPVETPPAEEPRAELPPLPNDETAGWHSPGWIPDWIEEEEDPQAALPPNPSDETEGWRDPAWVPEGIVEEETPHLPPAEELAPPTLAFPVVRRGTAPRQLAPVEEEKNVPRTQGRDDYVLWLALASSAAGLALCMFKRMRKGVNRG